MAGRALTPDPNVVVRCGRAPSRPHHEQWPAVRGFDPEQLIQRRRGRGGRAARRDPKPHRGPEPKPAADHEGEQDTLADIVSLEGTFRSGTVRSWKSQLPLESHVVIEGEAISTVVSTPSEVWEHAVLLGAKLERADRAERQAQLDIAREALQNPVPPGWRACSLENQTYYLHVASGEVQFHDPAIEHYGRRMHETRFQHLARRYRPAPEDLESGSWSLSRRSLDSDGLRAALSNLVPAVAKLDLSFNELADDGAVFLARSLELNESVAVLDLRANYFLTGTSIRAVATMLELNRTLRILDLSQLDIGDDETAVLAAALTCNRTLTSLYLAGNRVGVRGALALREALYQCRIEELDLRDNLVSGSALADLGVPELLDKNRATNLAAMEQPAEPLTPNIAHNFRFIEPDSPSVRSPFSPARDSSTFDSPTGSAAGSGTGDARPSPLLHSRFLTGPPRLAAVASVSSGDHDRGDPLCSAGASACNPSVGSRACAWEASDAGQHRLAPSDASADRGPLTPSPVGAGTTAAGFRTPQSQPSGLRINTTDLSGPRPALTLALDSCVSRVSRRAVFGSPTAAGGDRESADALSDPGAATVPKLWYGFQIRSPVWSPEAAENPPRRDREQRPQSPEPLRSLSAHNTPRSPLPGEEAQPAAAEPEPAVSVARFGHFRRHSRAVRRPQTREELIAHIRENVQPAVDRLRDKVRQTIVAQQNKRLEELQRNLQTRSGAAVQAPQLQLPDATTAHVQQVAVHPVVAVVVAADAPTNSNSSNSNVSSSSAGRLVADPGATGYADRERGEERAPGTAVPTLVVTPPAEFETTVDLVRVGAPVAPRAGTELAGEPGTAGGAAGREGAAGLVVDPGSKPTPWVRPRGTSGSWAPGSASVVAERSAHAHAAPRPAAAAAAAKAEAAPRPSSNAEGSARGHASDGHTLEVPPHGHAHRGGRGGGDTPTGGSSGVPADSGVSSASPKRASRRRHARKDSVRSPTSSSNAAIEWQRGDLIGRGSFGKVFMGMNIRTGRLIAVKQIKLQTEQDLKNAQVAEHEAVVLRGLRHPHIVELLGTDRRPHLLNILLEYVPGNSLDTVLQQFGPLDERLIRTYSRQLLDALAYCHEHRVVHRDIKAKNILVDTSGCAKLADFGSARLRQAHEQEQLTVSLNFNYTPLWTAPEVLGPQGQYDERIDVWSLGCTIIEMATAKAPWAEKAFENPFRALFHIANSGEGPRVPDSLSKAGRAFLARCLERDPRLRPGAAELLLDPWVVAVDDEMRSEAGSETSRTLSVTASSSAFGGAASYCASGVTEG